MQNQIRIFSHPKFGNVRTVNDENNNPFFCLADICKALDINNPTNVKQRLDNNGVVLIDLDTLYRKEGVEISKLHSPAANFISEPNLYRCIFQSKKKEAEEFQNWVFNEVLPSIRKNGSYTAPAPIHTTNTSLQALVQQSEILNGLIRNIVEQEQRLANVESKIQSYEDERIENSQRLLAIDTSDAMPVPEIDLASKCRQIVNTYAEATNTRFDDIWHAVYSRLYYQFKISVNQIHRHKNESKLQALVRLGHEKALYSAVCDVCK